jgi:hypothetical protein
MKLIEKKVRMNPETFAPELLVTVALDMELNELIHDPDSIKSDAEWGREFLNLIKEKVE